MTYTEAEIALAHILFARAKAAGLLRRRTIAIAVGLSTPHEKNVVTAEPTYRDYLAEARKILRSKKR